MTKATGTKHDMGKPDWSLIPFKQLEYVVQVFTFGCNKYGRFNWKKLADPENRYFAAALRHLAAYRKGEWLDPESGLPHLAHAVTNLIFLMWFGDKEGE